MPRYPRDSAPHVDPREAKLNQLYQLQSMQGAGEEQDRQGQQAMMEMMSHLYGIQHQQQMGPAEMANLQAETALRTGENQRASELAPLEQGRLTAETNAANTNAASNTSMRNATEDYRKTQALKDTYTMMFPPGTSVPPWAQGAIAHGQDLGQAMDKETATTNATKQAAIASDQAQQQRASVPQGPPTNLDAIKGTASKYLGGGSQGFGGVYDMLAYPGRTIDAYLRTPQNQQTQYPPIPPGYPDISKLAASWAGQGK